MRMQAEQGTAEVGSIHDARRDMYRQQVLRAAEAEFAKAGFAATPMNAIATTAGLSLATVYKVFAGKAEIWDALHTERMDALLRHVESAERGGSTLDRLLNGVRATALFLASKPAYLDLSLQAGGGWANSAADGHGVQRTVWSAGLDMIAAGVESAISAGELSGIRPRVAAGLIVSAMQVWLSDWAATGRDDDPAVVVDDMITRVRLMLTATRSGPE